MPTVLVYSDTNNNKKTKASPSTEISIHYKIPSGFKNISKLYSMIIVTHTDRLLYTRSVQKVISQVI